MTYDMVDKYTVVNLCGSTRFKNEYMEVQKRLTLESTIVISVGLLVTLEAKKYGMEWMKGHYLRQKKCLTTCIKENRYGR